MTTTIDQNSVMLITPILWLCVLGHGLHLMASMTPDTTVTRAPPPPPSPVSARWARRRPRS
ncbi:hypothetical protein [Pseudonocardia spinosispora]|uniref:hypothetical protein n=1 Tax=Pseudonocardia spinosispora TaxID=103441 RepID=UPI0004229648|nr:hypothetical protein [Pseudonocardia spinosispora]